MSEDGEHLASHLEKAHDMTVEALLHAIQLRDRDTGSHSVRATFPAMQLGLAVGLKENEIAQLRWGILLHDLGKLGVPDHILLKPGPLLAEEWEIVRKHPTFGYEMLSTLSFPRMVIDIVHCHHENWDGSGYPREIKGKNIPLAARIASIANVWDALTNNQPYRWAWSKPEALAYITNQAGTMFDPQLVEAFEKIVKE